MSNLPQSFQTPNEYIDYFCSRLTGAEFKILMVATRKITGWPRHRATLSDRISYTQIIKLTGITDRSTINRALKRLSKFGILKKANGKNREGQLYKIIRMIKKAGQQSLFDENLAVWKPDRTSLETRPDRSGNQTNKTHIAKPNSKNTHMATPLKKSLKKQLEMKFTEPIEAADHLREIATNGSEEKEAAQIALMILEQLWKWHADKNKANEELIKSWQWFFYAAEMWPRIVQQAWSEIKDRKLQGEKMRKPGAILTLRIKELTNGNPKDQNHV